MTAGCFWEIDPDYEQQRVVRLTLQKETMGHESFQNLIEGDNIAGLAVTDHMYLEISINGEKAGRIVVALYGEKVPLTVENFKQLCLGTQVTSSSIAPVSALLAVWILKQWPSDRERDPSRVKAV